MPGFECANHPGADAVWMCVGCEGVFCPDCVSLRKFGRTTVETCKGCGELCNAVQAGVSIQEADLSEDFVGAFGFPLRDAGPWIIAGGALFASVLQFFAPLIGFAMVWGIFLGYGMTVIQSTAEGRDNAPNWPEVESWGQVLRPMVLAWATAGLAFYPAYWAWAGDRDLLGAGLLLLGVAYAPMAWIAASVSQNFLAITPLTVLPLLFKMNARYWGACVLLLGLTAVGTVGMGVLSVFLPGFLADGLVTAAAFYLLMVEMRVLGLVWRHNAEALGLA